MVWYNAIVMNMASPSNTSISYARGLSVTRLEGSHVAYVISERLISPCCDTLVSSHRSYGFICRPEGIEGA